MIFMISLSYSIIILKMEFEKDRILRGEREDSIVKQLASYEESASGKFESLIVSYTIRFSKYVIIYL